MSLNELMNRVPPNPLTGRKHIAVYETPPGYYEGDKPWSATMGSHVFKGITPEAALISGIQYYEAEAGKSPSERDPIDTMLADLWKRRHDLTPKEWEEVAPLLLGFLIGRKMEDANVLRRSNGEPVTDTKGEVRIR